MPGLTPDPQDPQRWEAFCLPSPQPIKIALDGEYITLLKQDVIIFRFSHEDLAMLNDLVTLFNGLVRAGIIFGEIEEIKDILTSIRQGADR